MENCIRTAQAALLQSCQFLAKDVPTMNNVTLNQKFNVLPNITPGATDRFAMKYVTIGNGGHTVAVGPNNGSSAVALSTPQALRHTPRHTALYHHLPFVLRPLAEDLTPSQRTKYRLRVVEQHDGQSYVAYYAKVLDLDQTQPSLEYRTVNNGSVTSTPLAYTLDDLSPTPVTLEPGGVVSTSADYIASTAKINFSMTAFDIEELLKVSTILYGRDDFAIVSELALVAGIDYAASTFNGSNQSYTEVISSRVTHFVSTFFSAKFNNGSINTTLDIGSMETMLVTQ